MKLESLTVGQPIFRLAKRKMGQTTVTTHYVRCLVVHQIDTVKRRVVATDGSIRVLIPEGRLGQYRLQKPELVSRNGFSRPLTAAERAARKADAEQASEAGRPTAPVFERDEAVDDGARP